MVVTYPEDVKELVPKAASLKLPGEPPGSLKKADFCRLYFPTKQMRGFMGDTAGVIREIDRKLSQQRSDKSSTSAAR